MKKLFTLVLAAVIGAALVSGPIGCQSSTKDKEAKKDDTTKKDDTKKDDKKG